MNIGTKKNLFSLTLLLLLAAAPMSMFAQNSCNLGLATTTQNNGQSGVSFEVTATQSTLICRFKTQINTSGTQNYQVWGNPNGLFISPGVANTTGWVLLGSAPVTPTSINNFTEIPVDVNLLLDPGDTWGFVLFNTTTTGTRYRTGTTPFVFSDSYLTVNTQAWGVYGTPPNFTFGFYPRQFCGEVVYEEGCFFPDGAINYQFQDASGNPTSFVELPGNFNLHYEVRYPAEQSNVNVTVNLWSVTSSNLEFTYSFNAVKQAGQDLIGNQLIPVPASMASGYYRVEVIFNTKNSCMNYDDYFAPEIAILLIPQGTPLCEVWPGDTDNNGVVNYGDRRALNTYIFEANMRSTWLNGPARYDPRGGMAYLEWRPQASAPWFTDDGCYKDADGNGVINNFDYITIKLNWLKDSNPGPGKSDNKAASQTFGMSENYPNPFNPSTNIEYRVAERSTVTLVVADMMGRTVAELVNSTMEAGVFNATFDASSLGSGQYFARVNMVGTESGLSFSKTIKMTLTK